MVADSSEKEEENMNKCLNNWFYFVVHSVKLSIKAIIKSLRGMIFLRHEAIGQLWLGNHWQLFQRIYDYTGFIWQILFVRREKGHWGLLIDGFHFAIW